MSPALENKHLSSHEMQEQAEALNGAVDAIGDGHEMAAIEILLSKNDTPISWNMVQKHLMDYRSRQDQEAIQALHETLGFPSEKEPVEVTLMSPHDVQDHLMAERPGTPSYFNNEFALFQIDPRFRPGDALLKPSNFMDVAYATRPVRMRFRELFPNLYAAMYERSQDKGMREFYADLVEGTKEAQVALTLFTMSDQIMQRLIRLGDDEYQVAYGTMQGVEGRAVPLPKYEDVVDQNHEHDQVDARLHLHT